MSHGFLNLQACLNFRDIGGYPTVDGGQVRRRAIYRSGVLSYLTESDKAKISSLKLRAVCDLRDPHEWDREPTAWNDESVAWLKAVNEHEQPANSDLHASDDKAVKGIILDYYRNLPRVLVKNVKAMMDFVAHNEPPLLVHCALGKDRTGVTIAILQDLLGMTRTDIAHHYALSDLAFHSAIYGTSARAWLGVSLNAVGMKSLPLARRRLLMESRPDYVLAALEQIDSEYGNTTGYLRDCVGIDADTLSAVRQRLVVTPFGKNSD